MRSMRLPMSPQRTARRRLTRVRCYPLPIFTPVRISPCADVDARLQKLQMRLGQTKRQAVSSLKVPKSKSPLQPRRPNAPFVLGPCP